MVADANARRRERYATDPEYRAQRRAQAKQWAANLDPERRKQKSERAKARTRERYATDPEYRANVDARTTAYRTKPENRARLNKIKRERYREEFAADPEAYREKKREYAARRGPRRKNPVANRAAQLRRMHGLDEGGWARIWESQGGLCYLCGDALTPGVPNGTSEKPVLDHVHDHCGPRRSCPACRRGMACSGCNLLIGWAKDDPARLLRIAERLTAANAAARERIAALPGELTLFD